METSNSFGQWAVIPVMSQSADSGRDPAAGASESTPTSLLERVKAREAEAWERLVYIYGPLVYRWCRLAGLQGADAGDVAQDVFAAVADGITTFHCDRDGDAFRGWLWGITRHKIGDFFRRCATLPSGRGGSDAQRRLLQIPDRPPSESTPNPDPDGTQAVELRAIELIRAGVEERTWKAFWRVVVDEQPVHEVADELGMTTKAVYEAKYRLLKRFRQEFDGLID